MKTNSDGGQRLLAGNNTKREFAHPYPACVVCGSTNPKGLGISFRQCPCGVCADWIPTGDCESFKGTIHGGIITTVLDEAMSKDIIARNWEASTSELRVRFRGRVSPGETLHTRGGVIEKQKRKILTEATIATIGGEERAHAWATFLEPPKS